jgi:hypothetical protein
MTRPPKPTRQVPGNYHFAIGDAARANSRRWCAERRAHAPLGWAGMRD